MINQRGFGIAGVVATVLVLAISALIGYTVWKNYIVTNETANPETSQQQSAETGEEPATDIDGIADELESTELQDDSLEQLDAELTY